MSGQKKNGNENNSLEKIIFVTAILSLIDVLLELLSKYIR